MCRALKDAGCTVQVCTTNADGKDTLPVETGRLIEYEGVKTIFFPAGAGEFKYSREIVTWLDDYVREFDVVHVHAVFNHSSIAAARACRRHGVPYIVRPLGTLDPWSMGQKPLKKRMFWRAFGRRMLQNAAAVHYTSEGEKQAVESTLNVNHGVVVPLGVELTSPTTRHSSLRDPQFAAPYILFLSRLAPGKGLEALIEAFVLVIADSRFSHWRLHIAGDGDEGYVSSLKKAVHHRRIDPSVQFLGWLDGKDKVAAFGGASLVVLPSYHENFGISVVEAMAAGVPVLISPQVNLASEVERARAGWVIPTSVTSLREGLVKALSSETERQRRGRAAQDLAATFCWPNASKHMVELYRSLAA